MFRVLGLLLYICLAASAADSDPWLRIKSANFELFTTAGERTGRDLIRHFERVRSFFVQAFRLEGLAARPAQIIAFRAEKEYQPYQPIQVAAAFFQGGEAHDFIVMQSASSEHYPVAVHEYTHLLVRQSKLRIPVWFNEGLAELYSTLEPQGSKVLVGRIPAGRGHALLSEKWIPLRALLGVQHGSPLYNEKARAGMFYAQSWALVHMLQMSPAYAGKLANLAAALADEDADAAAAFERVCGKSLDQVERELRDYVSSPTLKARLFNIQLPKSVDAPEILANSILPARLALAEMQLSGPDTLEKGRAAYEQLAREFPDRWEPEAGLAHFWARKRDWGESTKHFSRAAELGSTDAGMFLKYGKILLYEQRGDEAVQVLRKAVDLDPTSVEARVDLGFAHVRASQFREALLVFQEVKTVTPELAPRYFYNFAYACYRLGGTSDAKQLIAKGRTYAKEPADTAALDRLSQALERAAGQPLAPATASDEAPPTAADQGPPRTRRSETPDPPAPVAARTPEFPVVEAVLRSVECIGGLARLHVTVSGVPRIFTITDPASVSIRGGNGAPIEFQCGKQEPRTVRISFEPSEMPGVTGTVRALDFP